MFRSSSIRRRVLTTFAVLGLLVASLAVAGGAGAEGAPFSPAPGYPIEGCYGLVTAGTGMWTGTGTIVADVPGPVVDAFLYWAGVDWGGAGELTVNGAPIVGTLIDTTPTMINHNDWNLWRADASGFVAQGANTLTIGGWEQMPPPYMYDKDWRNGATLAVVYERDPLCLDPVQIHITEGLDWFWYRSPGQFATDVHSFTFEAAPFDRTFSRTLAYAGVDHMTTECRGNTLWFASGTGTPPTQILQKQWPSTVGVNGGQLIAYAPFSEGHCARELYPPATSMTGGFIGAEWSIATVEVTVPAGATWVAFQMESLEFRNGVLVDGESGAWAGSAWDEVPLPTPDMVVTKDDGVSGAVPGDTLTYNLDYGNIGDRYGKDVVILDTIPDRTSFVSCYTPFGACSEAGGVVTFELGTVDAGASGTVQVTVQLDPIFPCGETPITNAVSISTSTPGDDLSNNAGEDTDIVTAYVTVDVQKTASPEPVEAGGALAYAIDWSIGGNCWAENTVITDPLPDLTTFVSCEPAALCAWAADALRGVVSWNLGTLTPGDTGTAQFTVNVDGCLPNGTLIENTATITEDSGEIDTDTVTSTVHADHAFTIDKVGNPKPVMKNDPLTYSILWAITGNEPAINVTITDLLPEGTHFDSATDGGVIDPETGVISWSLGDFCPPADGSVSFTVIVDRYLVDPAEVSNTAKICDDDAGTACAEDQDITPVIFTSEIGDLVWFDINANAVQEAGESGMPDVVLNLYDAGADAACGTADDTWLDTRTTDAAGAYLFDLLLEGSYCVAVDETTVAADHYLTPGMTNPHGPIPLAPDLDPDEQYLGADFGYYPGGSIGDYVWLDVNGDAVQDATEDGIAGVVINLYQAGADLACGTADDTLFGSQTTDADGFYLFDPLPMGPYCADVVESSLPADVFLSPGIIEPHFVNLGPGQDYLDADFGYYPGGSIGDYVWFDEDRDGVQDATETGIPGVSVALHVAGPDGLCGTADDTIPETTTTDPSGAYLFDPLPIGVYCVAVNEATLPVGLNLSAGSTNPHGPIDLGAWEDYLVADFGYAYPDVTITKAVDLEYAHRHEDVTFTIVVTNEGPGPANGVVVTDQISEYLEYIRLTVSQGTAIWNSGTRMVTANIGYLDEGDTATITITGRVIDIPAAELPVDMTDVAYVDFTGDPGPVPSNETITHIVYFAPGEIPEPSTMVLMGSGLLGLAGYAQLRLRRRRQR
jgi:uncharacterized repeat protein (TIGR01451 family)